MAIRYKSDLLKWSNSVKYDIASDFGDTGRIQTGIELIEQAESVKFERLTPGSKDAHIFFRKGTTCSAIFGKRVTSGPQNINVADDCDGNTVCHLIFGTLGFNHEHRRRDRGGYITVYPDRVPEIYKDYKWLLDMLEEKDYEDFYHTTSYDAWSCMHFPAYTLGTSILSPAISGKTLAITYALLKGTYGLSAGDVAALREWYGAPYDTKMTIKNNTKVTFKYYIIWQTTTKVGDTEIAAGASKTYDDVKDSFFLVGIKTGAGTPVAELAYVPIRSVVEINELKNDKNEVVGYSVGYSAK